jgi:hypothetical protein
MKFLIKLYSSEDIDKVMFKYPEVRDISMRLSHTVVRLNGDIAYIGDIISFESIPYEKWIGETKEKGFISYEKLSKNISLDNLKVGYCANFNKKNEFTWFSRYPLRHGKQGIVLSSCVNENGEALSNKNSTSIAKMFQNKYPAKEQFFKLIEQKEEDVNQFAISKNVALSYDSDLEFCKLHHKGIVVGLYDLDQEKVKLSKKYHWLQETLEEENLGIRYGH